jgi:hypothetical protein
MAVDVIAGAVPKSTLEVTPTFKHAVLGVVAVLTAFMVAKKLKR